MVRALQQADDDVLHVFAHVARFGQVRRVADREGDLEDPSERLREQRLAGARRAQKEDVRFLELDVIPAHVPGVDALVVIVDRH